MGVGRIEVLPELMSEEEYDIRRRVEGNRGGKISGPF